MRKPVFKRSVLHLLQHYAKRKYVAAGGSLSPTGPPVAAMVSFLVGWRVNQRNAWKWLHDQYKLEGKDLPPLKRAPKKKPSNASFYKSEEWRAVRFDALRLSDGCCSLCGRSKRKHGVVLHVDHIIPRSKRPNLALTQSNLQVLCEDCNMGKSNRDDTDWRPVEPLTEAIAVNETPAHHQREREPA